MKLLKSITVIAFLLSITTTHAQWGKWKKIKGDGNITTETRSTGSYDGLKASGSMDFKLVQGKEGEITIKGDANLMEYIFTEVKDEMLIVKTKKGFNLRSTKAIVITVPYESISVVSLSGSGDIENMGIIEANNFDVSIAGSGDIDLNVSAKNIESSISGSGDISLNGSTNNLMTKVAGSGDFNGKSLKSNNVEAKITGSGDVAIVCNGELKVRITGSGDVRYSGTPTKKDTRITGSGSVSN